MFILLIFIKFFLNLWTKKKEFNKWLKAKYIQRKKSQSSFSQLSTSLLSSYVVLSILLYSGFTNRSHSVHVGFYCFIFLSSYASLCSNPTNLFKSVSILMKTLAYCLLWMKFSNVNWIWLSGFSKSTLEYHINFTFGIRYFRNWSLECYPYKLNVDSVLSKNTIIHIL